MVTDIFPSHPLPQLCDIQSGFTVRGRLETTETGTTRVIQLRDTGAGELSFNRLSFADLGPVDERYDAREGDILFRTRFEPNVAVCLTQFPGTAVVTSPLLILRTRSLEADPRYIAWWINQPPAQTEIDRSARGTNMRMIPRQALDDLIVPLPDLETQRRIVEVDALSTEEERLLHALAEKRRTLTRFALLKQVRKAQPH